MLGVGRMYNPAALLLVQREGPPMGSALFLHLATCNVLCFQLGSQNVSANVASVQLINGLRGLQAEEAFGNPT